MEDDREEFEDQATCQPHAPDFAVTSGQKAFRDNVSTTLERLRRELPALGVWQLTFLARVPGEPDADLIVTQDDFQHLARMIRRAQARERLVEAGTGVLREEASESSARDGFRGRLAEEYDRQKFDRAMKRLDAEVAAHEETESIRCAGKAGLYHGSGEIEPYLKRHPEMLEDLDPDAPHGIEGTTGEPLGGPIVEPAAGKARFGDRVRDLWRRTEAARASAAAAWSEHELPHDRRERESARNEDSTGRVEGVDR